MAENFLSSVYNSLRHLKHAVIYMIPATFVNIMRNFICIFIYLFIYLLPLHMIFNNVIVEDTDQLSNLHGIVRDPNGPSMRWLALLKS